jgi:hypothetical protein
MLMSDALAVECGYTPTELKPLAEAAGIPEFGTDALQMLGGAFNSYCWACSADPGGFLFYSDEQKLCQLKHILKLIVERASLAKIEQALHELDGPTSQLLGKVGASHPRLQNSLRRVFKKITPRPGPDPRRARRQFIDDLADIYEYVTGRIPTRRVHDREYGPFREFVIAALTPFNAAQGCEADIKIVLEQREKRLGKRKNAAAA